MPETKKIVSLYNISNMLTLSRIAAVPVIVSLFLYIDTTDAGKIFEWIAAIVFIAASITDYLDGYLARAYKLETKLGALLDPVADKLMVISCLVMFVEMDRVSPILVIILVSRDILITGIRAAASSYGFTIPVLELAKIKTATQMVGIPFTIVGGDYFGLNFTEIGVGLLWLSAGLSVWSGINYLRRFMIKIEE
jgi:CDP-diacylglycerol--glycerol-3-phosphate 3-phosphatidyltransferase